MSGAERKVEGPVSEVRRAGARLGRIEAITAEGEVLVRIGEGPARSAWVSEHVPMARLVAAAREGTAALLDWIDADQPVIVGLLRQRIAAEPVPRRIELRAAETIAIRCGETAIEIDEAGRISVRGARVEAIGEEHVILRGARVDIN